MQIRKDGKRNNRQRYRCVSCGHRFQEKKRTHRKNQSLWRDYVWGKQTLTQLSVKANRGILWIQKRLDAVSVPSKPAHLPKETIIIADVTYFGKKDACLVIRSPNLKQNLLAEFVTSENPGVYLNARKELESQGCHIQALVLDGRMGVREVFSDIPVQMCHFHQKQILKRYLTSKPKLDASKELHALAKILSKTTEDIFTESLHAWYTRWEEFLKERSYCEDGKHWHYTHKRIRSAYRSLKTNLPYLFTYKRYPELNIPNTTNSLDGFFSQLKRLLRVHSGLNQKRRNRVIREIVFSEKMRNT